MSGKARYTLVFTLTVCLLVVPSSGTGFTWSIFRPSQFFNSSSSHLQEYARQKLSTLRNLRDKLNDQGNIQFIEKVNNGSQSSVSNNETTTSTTKTTENPEVQSQPSSSTPTVQASKREESFGSIFKNVDNILSFTTGPLRKMITSKQGIESLASMVMPKRDVLQKLLEIKGHLEPSFKRYITDKYNGFLSSLIPYSENIGVPPFVLNSMKIPQDFDPRWQFIKSLLESQGGIEKFLHNVVNGEFRLGKKPEVVQSRSGDETELISDQEPDASGKGYRKQQQLYLSSFKKRLMKPGGGKLRLMQQSAAAVGRPSSLDYESMMDQTGQYGHLSYDMRAPEEMSEPYYSVDPSGADMDMIMSASGHQRGHGHGHGHGQPSYGGFLDPFTILGGLAFLTYLGLMLQNSLNRTGNGTAAGAAGGAVTPGGGRNFPVENFLPIIPISLRPSPDIKHLQPFNATGHKERRGRSVVQFKKYKATQRPVTIDQVLDDIKKLWQEIKNLDQALESEPDPNCARFKQCKVVWKMRVMNLEPIFASKLLTRMEDQYFTNYVLRSGLRNMCEPYRFKYCE